MKKNGIEHGFDLIGDIHGQADKLHRLLDKLGYRCEQGAYRHPERRAIFLGDFIDRGPRQQGVLDTVMAMVAAGSALSVMGNHEYNALAFHTRHPSRPGTWLRPRDDKNIKQHLAFLNEYLGTGKAAALDGALAFFRALPLWLDLGGLRIVHAAWHPESMQVLQPLLGPGNTLTADLLVESSTPGTPAFQALEILLKGMEHTLPDGLTHKDKDGNTRTNVRYWFFRHARGRLRDVIVHPEDFDDDILDLEASDELLCGYPESAPPVFVGHYWMKRGANDHPRMLRHNVACLDYSAAKGGDLVAYRWNGEDRLNNDKFVY